MIVLTSAEIYYRQNNLRSLPGAELNAAFDVPGTELDGMLPEQGPD